jgi:hypothetical protein
MRPLPALLLLVLLMTCAAFAEPVPLIDENDLLHTRKSMIQTHTGYNQTEIHAVLPRLKRYRLKIQKISNDELVGDSFIIDPTIEAKDPSGISHQKINVFHIDNLEPNTEYHLELLERGNTEESSSGDLRRFKTLDPNKKDVKFTAASCLCDEPVYNDTKIPIWTQKRLTNPDLIFLLGDITYVDSFDVVNKPDITSNDIWQRYVNSFIDSPGTKMYRLIPTISTWDDHDSSNNANQHTPTLRESLALFNLIYGGRSIPGVIENGVDGTYKWVTYGNVEFSLFDSRTFREKYDTPEIKTRYGHFGQTQEEWFFERASKTKKPLILIKGDMWGSPLITDFKPNGEKKRITESFYGDHEYNYFEFNKRLQTLENPVVYISGDIHRAQFIRHGPNQSVSRFNRYETTEWTTSPLYSYRYNAHDEDTPGWEDKDRYAHKNIYNFAAFSVKSIAEKIVFNVEIRGNGKKNKDGSPADWTRLAPPVLVDTLVLNSRNPVNSCHLFYNSNPISRASSATIPLKRKVRK